nr:hypothetical protein [Parashewanella hymeniacidonis]
METLTKNKFAFDIYHQSWTSCSGELACICDFRSYRSDQSPGLRTMAITMSCYLTMVLWIGLFGNNASAFVAAIIGAPILFLTAQRRCRDANKPQWIGLLSQLPWWLMTFIVSFSGSVSWWLAIALLGIIGSMLLAVPPSRSVGRFEYGYHGPATQKMAKLNTVRRVEPSLNGDVGSSDSTEFANSDGHSSIGAQIQEVIEEAPINQKQWLIAGAGLLGVVVIGIFINGFFTGNSNADDEQDAEQQQPPAIAKPKESVSLQDGFQLSLQDDKLFMIWLGSDGNGEMLWQLADAKGDRSCRQLRFNNGTVYRPMTVERLADRNNSTQAGFSPLDTKDIIKDIARRGKVSICGYNFSLKGSQSDLSKSAVFRAYIE